MTVSLKKSSAVLVDTVAEAKAVKASMALLQVQLDRLNAQIVTLNGGVDILGKVTLTNGDAFTISEVNTYNKDAMTAALKPGQVRLCQKTELDSAKVKALFPEVYKAAKVNKGVKVTLG